MKRIYIAILCFWIALGLGLGWYFKDNVPKPTKNSIKLFYSDTTRHHYYWESQHSKIFFRATIIGALVIVGFGVIDKSKN